MTIKQQKKPYKAEEVEKILHPLVKKWFFSRFKQFSLPQLHGVMEIHKRNNNISHINNILNHGNVLFR